MSELNRRDIIQTVGQAVSAYFIALGVAAAGIAFFFSLVNEVQSQQKSLEELQAEMQILIAEQEARGEQIDELLEWIRQQREEGS